MASVQPTNWDGLQGWSPMPPLRLQTAAYEHQIPLIRPGSVTGIDIRRLGNTLFFGQTILIRGYKEKLLSLQHHYTFLDEDGAMIELLRAEPTLFNLLLEAVEPINRAFGEIRILTTRIQAYEDDTLLKIVALLPAHPKSNPEDALLGFDQDWWLNNCHRSRMLVFDYEIQDAL